MFRENPETIRVRSTLHSGENADVRRKLSTAPDVRHAMVVVNRALRSSRKQDDVLQDRICRAACLLKSAGSTETAFASGRPVDVVFRIASRIVRRLGL